MSSVRARTRRHAHGKSLTKRTTKVRRPLPNLLQVSTHLTTGALETVLVSGWLGSARVCQPSLLPNARRFRAAAARID